MSYEVDESQLWAGNGNWQKWVIQLVKEKIREIKLLDNPYSQGGEYRGKWAYPVGKLHIIAEIDDNILSVKLVKLIKLP